MKEIQLSKQGKNKGLYVALVDDEDFEFINRYRWHINISKHGTYASRYNLVNGKRSIIRMHWVIMDRKLIDHIDGNGLNNQRSNLRFCTTQQNAMNSKINKNGASIYKGVTKQHGRKTYISQIIFNNKNIYLGSYSNEIEAAKAYDRKAKELFGEFAHINF